MKKKLHLKNIKKKHIYFISKGLFWFSVGGILALFFLISFTFILFRQIYSNTVYPGVIVYGVDLGGKTQQQVQAYFDAKNARIQHTLFSFTADNYTATLSAQQLHLGYDSKLIATQAYSIGRSTGTLSNLVLIFEAYLYGIHLPPAYHYNTEVLNQTLIPLAQQVYKAPVDAVLTMQYGRVTAFSPSENGQMADITSVQQKIAS